MSTVDLHKVALEYHARGWNVLPVDGKRPNVSGWKKWQTMKQDVGEINRLESYWGEATGIAVVCGEVSAHLGIIDLDSQEAIDLFYDKFPEFTNTYTVLTGSGTGRHLYFYQHKHYIGNNKISIGNGEISLRMTRMICVCPPSIHPDTKQPYTHIKHDKIRRVATLGRIVKWMDQSQGRSTSKRLER